MWAISILKCNQPSHIRHHCPFSQFIDKTWGKLRFIPHEWIKIVNSYKNWVASKSNYLINVASHDEIQ